MSRAHGGATDGLARLRAMLAACALALLAAPGAAFAAPPVTNTNDSGTGSLRAAIAGAVNGDTINVPAGTYTLTSGALLVDSAHDITIAGAGGGRDDHQRQQRQPRLPRGPVRERLGPRGDDPGSHRDQRPRRGQQRHGGGGILSTNASQLTLNRVVVTGNVAVATDNASTFGGGGVANESSNDLAISDSTISGNNVLLEFGPGSGSGGGGVFSNNGDLSIDGSTISGNVVNSPGDGTDIGGGGVYLGGGAMVILNSTITGNAANVQPEPIGSTNGGGGLLVDSNSNAGIQNATIAGNTTSQRGGGILAAATRASCSWRQRSSPGTARTAAPPPGSARSPAPARTSRAATPVPSSRRAMRRTPTRCSAPWPTTAAPRQRRPSRPAARRSTGWPPARAADLAADSSATSAGCRGRRAPAATPGPSSSGPRCPPSCRRRRKVWIRRCSVRTVNVRPVSGKVFFAVPAGVSAAGVHVSQKGLRFRPLSEARQLPVRQLPQHPPRHRQADLGPQHQGRRRRAGRSPAGCSRSCSRASRRRRA